MKARQIRVNQQLSALLDPRSWVACVMQRVTQDQDANNGTQTEATVLLKAMAPIALSPKQHATMEPRMTQQWL